jgi:hypothetical protein
MMTRFPDKYTCKGKKPRATNEEVAVKRAAELARLNGLNLSLLSEGKRKSTVTRIEKLEIKVKADELTHSTFTIEIFEQWVWHFQCNKNPIFR